MNCLCGSKWAVLEAGLSHVGRLGTDYRPTQECLLHDRPKTLPRVQYRCPICSLTPSSPHSTCTALAAPLGTSYSSRPLTPTQP